MCVCVQTFLLPQQSIVCDMYPKVIPEEKSNNSIVVILHMRHMGPWLKSAKIRKTALKSALQRSYLMILLLSLPFLLFSFKKQMKSLANVFIDKTVTI